jgi:hypothetical protein
MAGSKVFQARRTGQIGASAFAIAPVDRTIGLPDELAEPDGVQRAASGWREPRPARRRYSVR